MKNLTFILAMTAAICITNDLLAQGPGGRGPGRGGPPSAQQEGEPGERGRGGRGMGGQQMQASPLVAALDTNKDGKLSREEIENAVKAIWTLDKNDDGVVDASEMRPQGRGPRGGAGGGQGNPEAPRGGGFMERLMENDENEDGKLSKDEVPERMQRGFDRMDTNEDGFIDKAELEAMAERFSGRGRGGAAGSRGGRGGAGGGRGGQGGRGGENGGGN